MREGLDKERDGETGRGQTKNRINSKGKGLER